MPCGLHIRHKAAFHWIRETNNTASPADSFPSHHSRGFQIGTGSPGTVETWTHISTGHVLAVKIIRTQGQKLPREVEMLKNLPLHDSIVRCYAFYANRPSSNSDSILFENYPVGDLWEVREQMQKRNKGVFSEGFIWAVFSQLASALAFLHAGVGTPKPRDADFWRPVVHRDIKIENVLVSTLGDKEDWSSIVIKLGDFGFAAYYDPNDAALPGRWGTTILWPPEQTWETHVATPAGDVWAISCVVHELAHGFPPVVDPNFTMKIWMKSNSELPYPKSWCHVTEENYWGAKTPRQVISINLEPGSHEWDTRRKRSTPRYSDNLDMCMKMALMIDVKSRATAESLKVKIEEGHASFLFEELRVESEAWQDEARVSNSEDEWSE